MAGIVARNPTPGEVEKAAEVASKAFPDLSLAHWQDSFAAVARLFGERYIMVAELDGEIVSSLSCRPAPVYMAGALVPHAAVGAVGTVPEHRGKGCAGAMLTECVRMLREEGICLSSLWPFSYEYYRKFGWEVGSEARLYSAKGGFFQQLGDPAKARGAGEADLEHIKSVFAAFAPNYNCLTLRDDVWWTDVVRIRDYLKLTAEPGLGAVVHEVDGVVDGYAAYEIRAGEDGNKLSVHEMFFSGPRCRRDMLALLGSLVPDSTLKFPAPLDDLYLHDLPNPRAVETALCPGFQFRVIDPEKAILALAPMEHVSARLTFSISDPVFKHGLEFGVEVEGGKVSRCRPNRRQRLEMDVQTLARLYSGYLNAVDAWQLGMLRVPPEGVGALVGASGLFSVLTPYRSRLEPG